MISTAQRPALQILEVRTQVLCQKHNNVRSFYVHRFCDIPGMEIKLKQKNRETGNKRNI